jgi:HNH endonuclease
MNLTERFWSLVDKTDSCWIWKGPTAGAGYGVLRFQGERIYAHRFSYELYHRCEPEHTIDHLCRNRLCVNPTHLEDVPSGVNTRRGFSLSAINARKTHCPKGHPYDRNRTYKIHGKTKTARTCGTCLNILAERKRRRLGMAPLGTVERIRNEQGRFV